MIEKIKIENLTVFENLEIDTSAPINVFIGENGTGKTQILKFIHMMLSNSDKENSTPEELEYLADFDELLENVGFSSEIKIGLSSNDEGSRKLLDKLKELGSSYEDIAKNFETLQRKRENLTKNLEFMSINHLNKSQITRNQHLDIILELILDDDNKTKNFIFIPAKDMLTHSKGLPAMKKEYGANMPFDDIYVNIIEKASKWNKKDVPEIAKKVVPILEDIMDGVVEIINEVFYIKKRNGKMIPFDFEAEGIKKIGLLWQLFMGGTITEGTILLWDEPESNLNPKLSSTIAWILLELSRSGVQIFLTTHNYFLAKYFDILEKDKKEVVFHSLYRADDNPDSPTLCETNDTFSMLNRNSILEEIVELFETEMEWE